MVEVGLHVVLVALQYLQGKHGLFRGGIVAILKAVRLLVCLGHNVNSVLVAQVVPHGVVGIMARAHGIDVELFHYADVLHHTFAAHHVSAVGVYLMAVGSLDKHGLTVNQQLRVAYLNLSETHLLVGYGHISVLLYLLGLYVFRCAHVYNGCSQRVEIRCFGCPLVYVGHFQLCFTIRCVGAGNNFALGIQQFMKKFSVFLCLSING